MRHAIQTNLDGPKRDAKGHCHGDEETSEDATFRATFTGDVTGVATPLFGPQSSKKRIVGGDVHQPEITLTFNEFLQTAAGYSDEEGPNCFPAKNYRGILGIGQNTPGSDEMRIQYNFKANGTDGTEDIGYTLILRGVLDPAEWVPEVDETATINVGTFEIAPSHGPGAISCKGTGIVNFSIDVELNAPA